MANCFIIFELIFLKFYVFSACVNSYQYSLCYTHQICMDFAQNIPHYTIKIMTSAAIMGKLQLRPV
jgi:hypothetical protein